MYIHMEDVAFAVYHYFTERSKKDVEFAVQVGWYTVLYSGFRKQFCDHLCT